MKRSFIILFFSLNFLIGTKGQIPDKPTNFNLSIIPASGWTIFKWTQTDTSDVDGYFIGFFFPLQNGYLPVDTVWGAEENQRIWKTENGRQAPLSYSISALKYDSELDSFRLSQWFDSVKAVWISEIFLDECTNKVNIKWTPYYGWFEDLTYYIIYKNSEPYDTVPMNITSYFDANIESDSIYSYYIEANNINGLKSTSYAKRIVIRIKNPPSYIQAKGSEIIDDNKVRLNFEVDPATELNIYYLIRGENINHITDTIEIMDQPGGGMLSFEDELPEAKPYYYQLLSMNDCGLETKRSNITSTLHLNATNAGNRNLLTWNPYVDWSGGIKDYKIYRSVDGGTFELLNPGPEPHDTSYTDRVGDLILEQGASEFCYYLTATEGGNVLQNPGFSKSNEICANAKSVILMPNAFTPNGDDLNDTFKPVLTFSPKSYLFIIRNRWGNTVFETDNPEASWKGDSKGKPVPEGVYVFFVKAEDQQGKVLEKTGQVMVFFPEK